MPESCASEGRRVAARWFTLCRYRAEKAMSACEYSRPVRGEGGRWAPRREFELAILGPASLASPTLRTGGGGGEGTGVGGGEGQGAPRPRQVPLGLTRGLPAGVGEGEVEERHLGLAVLGLGVLVGPGGLGCLGGHLPPGVSVLPHVHLREAAHVAHAHHVHREVTEEVHYLLCLMAEPEDED